MCLVILAFLLVDAVFSLIPQDVSVMPMPVAHDQLALLGTPYAPSQPSHNTDSTASTKIYIDTLLAHSEQEHVHTKDKCIFSLSSFFRNVSECNAIVWHSVTAL